MPSFSQIVYDVRGETPPSNFVWALPQQIDNIRFKIPNPNLRGQSQIQSLVARSNGSLLSLRAVLRNAPNEAFDVQITQSETARGFETGPAAGGSNYLIGILSAWALFSTSRSPLSVASRRDSS